MTLAAITVRHPWALAISSGRKNIENRTRPTSFRGQLAIHAGAARSKEGDLDERIIADWGQDASRLAPHWYRAVIAVVDLIDCHPSGDACTGRCIPWGDPTGYHLVLANARRLDDPVPAKGSLGLPWRLPEDVDQAVRDQLAEEVSRG